VLADFPKGPNVGKMNALGPFAGRSFWGLIVAPTDQADDMRRPHRGSLRRAPTSNRPLAQLLAASIALAMAEHAAAADCPLEPGLTRAVARVLDGETLALDDGTEVRLIGALSPRPHEAGADVSFWPPEREAMAELGRLVLGHSIELAFAGRRTDRYGRLLAHVFVLSGTGRVWVQGHMLRTGHARAYSLPDNVACMDELLAHERLARDTRKGLWDHAAYQIRPAERTWDLLRWRSSFQLVEGRVMRVASVRSQVFLNFGDNWREDFTANVRRRLPSSNLDFKTLEGRLVRIRGWIDRRAGPAIDIHHPSQIELVTEHEPAEFTRTMVPR
jgi:micrococcal nuclease